MIDLTIIIPIYNVEQHLCECIDSVFRQAPESSQIILVDDGSKDHSPVICDDYAEKDQRIEVIHKENGGISSARNIGLSRAKGSFVFFVDSDDYLDDAYFHSLFQHKADLIIGSFIAFYSDGHSPYCLQLDSKKYDSLSDYLLDFFLYYPVIFNTAWGKVYNLDIINKYQLRFREDLFMVEDVLFNIEYYSHCHSIAYDSNAILYYRQGEGTLSKKQNALLFNWYQESYSKIKNLLQDNNVFSFDNQQKYYQSLWGNTLECLTSNIHLNMDQFKEIIKNMLRNNEVVISATYSSDWKTHWISKSFIHNNPTQIIIATKFYCLAAALKSFGRKIYGNVRKNQKSN